MTNHPICIIKNRLYWVSDVNPPKDIPKAFFFNIDHDLVYDSFYEDFGPLNLSKIWRYITEVSRIISDPNHKDNVFYHFTSVDYKKCTNACLLMCCFSMIVLHKSPEQAYQPFLHIQFKGFRDASYGECSYKCTILDCLRGLGYAMKLGWFDFKKFNISEYQHYESIQNGDINWIIPDKFAAFSSPHETTPDQAENQAFSPKQYVPIFKKLKITNVVRLNTRTYYATDFIQNGIGHRDMYFTDGTSPSLQIVKQFLQYCESAEGAIAVHCKAGLGRTGTLIACYAIKHYCFNAADFIGWIRLCRPGSILGPQQHFLIDIEKKLKQQSLESPIWKTVSRKFNQKELQKQLKSSNEKETKMNQKEKYIQMHGDKGQGERLKKKNNQ